MHKVSAKFQDKIINVSEYDRKLAIEHKIAPLEKLVTIHNGIDHKNLKFLDKHTARKTLIRLVSGVKCQVSDVGTWVGSIGRLVREKNYETFIEAASLIKDKTVNFFIIGSGPEHKNLKLKIKNLKLEGRFFIIENLAPAAPYLKAFDTFILSSIKEGLPYTLLEAMAAERPIITTRVGGMTEIMENKGLVILPKEPQELARAINYFLNNADEAQKAAAQAQQMLKNELSLEQVLEKTTGVYCE